MPQPDLPVILQHDLRGLLTIEDEHLELLQLTTDGKRAWVLYNADDSAEDTAQNATTECTPTSSGQCKRLASTTSAQHSSATGKGQDVQAAADQAARPRRCSRRQKAQGS
jgi:hypothetical protein